jgi:hypothetical protein
VQTVVGSGETARHIGLNLKKLKTVVSRLIVGEDGPNATNGFHKVELYYSPWDRVGCPFGKECGRVFPFRPRTLTFKARPASKGALNFDLCDSLGDSEVYALMCFNKRCLGSF